MLYTLYHIYRVLYTTPYRLTTTLCHPTHIIYTTFSHPILPSQRGCSSAIRRRDFASWSQLKSYIHHSDTLLTSYIQHSHTLHSRRSAAQALQAAGVISTSEFKSYIHHSDTLLTWHIQHSDILLTSQRGCSSATSRRGIFKSSQVVYTSLSHPTHIMYTICWHPTRVAARLLKRRKQSEFRILKSQKPPPPPLWAQVDTSKSQNV